MNPCVGSSNDASIHGQNLKAKKIIIIINQWKKYITYMKITRKKKRCIDKWSRSRTSSK